VFGKTTFVTLLYCVLAQRQIRGRSWASELLGISGRWRCCNLQHMRGLCLLRLIIRAFWSSAAIIVPGGVSLARVSPNRLGKALSKPLCHPSRLWCIRKIVQSLPHPSSLPPPKCPRGRLSIIYWSFPFEMPALSSSASSSDSVNKAAVPCTKFGARGTATSPHSAIPSHRVRASSSTPQALGGARFSR